MSTNHKSKKSNENPITCQICGRECKSYGSLAQHIRCNHPDYNSQKYYDEFLATAPPMGTFVNISKGYCGADPNGKHQCALCDIRCKSISQLSKHIRFHHPEYTSQRYHDEFMSTASASCVICGSSEVEFIGLGEGYTPTCGHSCAGIHHRANLRNDTVKYDKFISKLSSSVEDTWKNRSSEEKEEMRQKVSAAVKESMLLLTEEERKAKFGWLNRLSEDEKQQFIDNVIMNTGCHAWWRDAPEEDKQRVIEQRVVATISTRLGVSIDEAADIQYDRQENRSDREKYYLEVQRITERNYRLGIDIIDPDRKRGTFFHLDHVFSVLHGYHNDVDPEIIGSVSNLRIIPAADNLSKSCNCDITLEELLERNALT